MDIRRPDSIKDASYIEPKQEQKSESPIKQVNTGISKAKDSFETVQFGNRSENSLGLTQSNSQTGTQDLNQREEKIANDKAPVSEKPPEQQKFGGDARTRFENSREALMKQFSDIYGQPRGDGSISSGDGSNSGGGGAGSVGGLGRATPEQREKFNAMTGNNYGPSTPSMDTFKDPAASTSSRGGRVYQSGFNQLMDQANDTSSSSGPDQGMIANGELISTRDNPDGSFTIVSDKVFKGGSEHKETTNGRETIIKIVENEKGGHDTTKSESYSNWNGTKITDTVTTSTDSEHNVTTSQSHLEKYKDGTSKETIQTTTENSDGSITTSIETKTTDSNGKVTYSAKKEKTTPPPSQKDTEQDEASGARKVREKIGNLLGPFDPVGNLPKAPKIQGDRDPDPEAVANKESAPTNSAIAQQGQLGLLGQPNEDREVGGSGNVSTGGNIDYEDRAGWGGKQIEEDPSDVDVTPGASQELPPAANKPNQEEKSKTDSRFTKDQPVAASGRENISRVKI